MFDREISYQNLWSTNLPPANIDTLRIMQELHSCWSVTCRNVENFGIEYSLYVVNYVRIYELAQFKSKLRHTGTWSTTAWPPHRLCYRPAVVFHYLLLVVLSVAQGTIWRTLQEWFWFHGYILITSKNKTYKYQQIINILEFWQYVSAVKSHHQAKIEQCLGTMKVCTQGDPIECKPSLYLDIVLFWLYDGFLQLKYFAKILKYC